MELRLGTCSRRGRQCAIGRVKGTAAGALQFMCEHLERWTLCGPPPPRACRAVHSPIKGCHDRWQRGRRPGCYGAGFLAAAAAFAVAQTLQRPGHPSPPMCIGDARLQSWTRVNALVTRQKLLE